MNPTWPFFRMAQCPARLLAFLCLAAGSWALAQPPAAGHPPAAVSAVAADGKHAELGIAEWLARMHAAARKRAYIGTFVVSAGTNMSSARIWHICDGTQQMERVESLSGPPRSTFRRNDQVVTFLPETRTAVAERRMLCGAARAHEELGPFLPMVRTWVPRRS